ncbi:MAG TPA: right-handed parallel beta-helix repeat-containing protein [Thermodesulfovibrionales bacterium]|nr:right-handed parallel beta-helix repeat-containing protein [Thermodesulfovibrionales bacterium]
MKSDTVWSGEVSLTGDILVPEGIVLTILPGTVVRISSSESTKTDPEYMSPLTEITVRGTLRAEGKEGTPITFAVSKEGKPGVWAGIIVDGGKAVLQSCTVQDADTGVYVTKGSVEIVNSTLGKNRYGLVVQEREANVRIENTQVKDNDYGVFLFSGTKLDSRDSQIKGNRKKDSYAAAAKRREFALKEHRAEKRDKSRVYGDEALLGTTVWQGRIEVNGIIRVPGDGRLIILPGTIVEFRRKDTDGDTIGENGLLVQGSIIAKGTPEEPILFRSAEKQKRMGDWDAINIMNSDKVQNLIEYCQIEDAYRGLHFHFSNVVINGTVLRNNYRGIQFQESTVEIAGAYIYGNKSGLQARDSEVVLSGNYIVNNYSGANLFRNSMTVRGNTVASNFREGLRVREGIPIVEENLIHGNRYGLMVADSVYGRFNNNVISHNLEAGLSLKGTDNIEISGNAVQSNGFNGINVQDSSAFIKGNLISDNGERGIGVLSFNGIITGNNMLENGLYALEVEGRTDVSARMNWWGAKDVRKAVFDKEDDPSKGRVDFLPVRDDPVTFRWPLKTIETDTIWRGNIGIEGNIALVSGTNLAVLPGVNVSFSRNGGLKIRGRIMAIGGKNARITFTSVDPKAAGDWDEILLEHADGSVFSHCTFENATWALHTHFTDLQVENCLFARNYGGVRFRSGPLMVRHSIFTGNVIGLRAYMGNASILDNVITDNETGIFVREKGGGLTIARNNLFANRGYNIRVGDFNDEDVDARDNWWGDAAPSETIFDGRREPGIGKVNFEPYAKEPFKIDMLQGSGKENKTGAIRTK